MTTSMQSCGVPLRSRSRVGAGSAPQARHDVFVEIKQHHRHVHRYGRHRQQEDILETLLHAGGLLGRLPFLEERGEGIAVQQPPGLRIVHPDLAVAAQGKLVQMDPPPGPAVEAAEPVQGDRTGPVRTGKDIIHAERPLRQRLWKRFCRPQSGRQQHQGQDDTEEAVLHYSTVTDLARLRGWSTSRPLAMAMW